MEPTIEGFIDEFRQTLTDAIKARNWGSVTLTTELKGGVPTHGDVIYRRSLKGQTRTGRTGRPEAATP